MDTLFPSCSNASSSKLCASKKCRETGSERDETKAARGEAATPGLLRYPLFVGIQELAHTGLISLPCWAASQYSPYTQPARARRCARVGLVCLSAAFCIIPAEGEKPDIIPA